jgi:glycosyltransferase involved in cell wall biosynthesis
VAVLDTWCASVPRPHDVAFLADTALASELGDPRIWPCVPAGSKLDTMEAIPLKLREGLRRARELEWDWIVKTDDDCYLEINRLLEHLRSLPTDDAVYVGNGIGHSTQGDWFAPYAALAGGEFPYHWGFGFALNRAAFDAMWPDLDVSLCRIAPRVDDCTVGAVARRRGVRWIAEPHIYCLDGRNGILRGSAAIGLCSSPEEMRTIHFSYREGARGAAPGIVSARTAYGNIGLDGWLGYEDGRVVLAGTLVREVISAHAPSRVVLRWTPGERLRLQGAINDTSQRAGAAAHFAVESLSGVRLRDLGRATRRAPTGEHDVEVPDDGMIALVAEPDHPIACHSVWRVAVDPEPPGAAIPTVIRGDEDAAPACVARRRREIWVAGYPSYYGGADTELDHQISLWLASGVDVHLVPNGAPDRAMLADVTARGAITHAYRPDIFAGKLVVSYCNGPFLERLPIICGAGRPRTVVWLNCMTWTSAPELECHRRGLIDLFGFQSRYQRSMLLPQLEACKPLRELEGYRPFFDLDRWSKGVPALATPPEECGYYGLGRVSRDDRGKYPADLWSTFRRVTAPRPVKCFVLGWGDNARQKCGPPQAHRGLDWMVWGPGAVPAHELYRRVHTLMHQTGGSRENWPRVAFEAWASGVALLAERDYAWPELVADGETGILCASSDEFAQRASELAFDEPKRRGIVEAARGRLVSEHCNPGRSLAVWADPL